METIRYVFDWLAGGSTPYMSLIHCMNHDWFWIGLTVGLDLAIAAGYVVIARHWARNERLLPDSPAKRALARMKTIFLFCGLCGYLFIPIKMVWPAWRLYDAFLIALAYYTWSYALSARSLGVIYSELTRTDELARDLEATRDDSRRKSHFLNAISHDLRTPLNGLVLQAELAELSLESDDREGLSEAVAEIKACARTTATLLHSFMELGRLDWSTEVSRPTTFDLSGLLDESAARVRTRAEQAGLRLRVAAPAGVELLADRPKVERIVVNLLDNAVKYTRAGGVELVASVTGRDATIRVVDTGPGIPPGHREQVFDEFYQVQNAERDFRKGFGLGLSIARKLALQLGGELILEDRPGPGSCFRLALPGVVVAGAKPAPAPPSPLGATADAAALPPVA